MSPFATHPGFDQARDLFPCQNLSSMAVGFSIVESAPWVYSALSDLWDLVQTGQDVRGFGDFSVRANTAIRVRKLLARIGDIPNLPVPTVNVFSGGGITLTWEMGSREAKYTFWPEGILTYCKEDNGETVEGNELPTDSAFNPREPVQWLLKRTPHAPAH